jgi:membrane protease YdiL (CAAX protease family)
VTPEFENFIAPARARPQVWRLVVGFVLALAIYAVSAFGLIFWVFLDRDGFSGGDWATDVAEGSSPTGVVILLMTFAGMLLGAALSARLLHKRRAGTLFGRAPRVLRDFVISAGIVTCFLAVSLFLWSLAFDAVPGVPTETWLSFLALAVLGLLIQTGAEEVLFRGYVMQQLAARFAAPAIWLGVQAVLFGLVHANPGNAPVTSLIVIAAATAFGLVAGDLTARTGSIGAAWGFHFVNNFAALLILGTQGSLSGLALFKTPYGMTDHGLLAPLIAFDVLIMVLAWLTLRRILGNR